MYICVIWKYMMWPGLRPDVLHPLDCHGTPDIRGIFVHRYDLIGEKKKATYSLKRCRWESNISKADETFSAECNNVTLGDQGDTQYATRVCEYQQNKSAKKSKPVPCHHCRRMLSLVTGRRAYHDNQNTFPDLQGGQTYPPCASRELSPVFSSRLGPASNTHATTLTHTRASRALVIAFSRRLTWPTIS